MNEVPISQTEVKNLRYLRILVTVLTATMILGLLTIVAVFVIRFPRATERLPLPAEITLPDGSRATAFTQGPDWYAVVTSDDQILIYDLKSGRLRQTILIKE